MKNNEVSSYDDGMTTNARTTAGGVGYTTDESPLFKRGRNRDNNSSIGAPSDKASHK